MSSCDATSEAGARQPRSKCKCSVVSNKNPLIFQPNLESFSRANIFMQSQFANIVHSRAHYPPNQLTIAAQLTTKFNNNKVWHMIRAFEEGVTPKGGRKSLHPCISNGLLSTLEDFAICNSLNLQIAIGKLRCKLPMQLRIANCELRISIRNSQENENCAVF
jgi:hypothetical protein